MQVVIDIPENEYRLIKEIYENNDIVEKTYSYIYHGTPLPKGHGRLIDANALIPNIHGVKSITAEYCAKRAVEGMFAGKLIIVPEKGLGMVAKAAQLSPRSISLALTGKLQSEKQKNDH